ncbi:hypothetical protein C162_30420 [Paenibacillus sp. FSL R7-269]|uniref:hypothetical protein n=1 Tax=Paenibacillus sp. FSL R7-269 TaxID=1226755 RepID=UPI0003E257B6|nr:hypothetical protein [Paenibacillus sp. FSL R7-269]ETT33949.1 hypothetical protein C162_30420 [Paenibacillus sp. FSL R7-269]
MKVKILFILLTVSLTVNVVIFYGLSKFDLVEKGSTISSITKSASTSIDIPNTSKTGTGRTNTSRTEDSLTIIDKDIIEAKVKSGYGYIYSLTDDQITKAINEGKQDPAYIGEDFKLPVLSSTSKDRAFEYMGVFIDTPYRYVAIYSSDLYENYGRTSSINEVYKFIGYDHISFSAYVLDGWAQKIAMEFKQEGEIIQPYKTENNENGTNKSIKFSVNDIDFREPAYLKIYEKSNPEKYAEYKIAFEDYVK